MKQLKGNTLIMSDQAEQIVDGSLPPSLTEDQPSIDMMGDTVGQIKIFVDGLLIKSKRGKVISARCTIAELVILLNWKRVPTLPWLKLPNSLKNITKKQADSLLIEFRQQASWDSSRELGTFETSYKPGDYTRAKKSEKAYLDRISKLPFAERLWHEAFVERHSSALTIMGLAQLEGWGKQEANEVFAKRLLKSSASQGCPDASYSLKSAEMAATDNLLIANKERNESDYWGGRFEEDQNREFCSTVQMYVGNTERVHSSSWIHIFIMLSRLSSKNLIEFGFESLLGDAKEKLLELAQAPNMEYVNNEARFLIIEASTPFKERIEKLRALAFSKDRVKSDCKVYVEPDRDEMLYGPIYLFNEVMSDPYDAALHELAELYSPDCIPLFTKPTSDEWSWRKFNGKYELSLQDIKEAERCLKLLMDQGDDDAKIKLATLILAKPHEVLSPESYAIELCQEVLANPHYKYLRKSGVPSFGVTHFYNQECDAFFLLGRSHLRGQGVSIDIDLAKSYLESSVESYWCNPSYLSRIFLNLGWSESEDWYTDTLQKMLERFVDIAFKSEPSTRMTLKDLDLLLKLRLDYEGVVNDTNQPNSHHINFTESIALLKLLIMALEKENIDRDAVLKLNCIFPEAHYQNATYEFILARLFMSDRIGLADLDAAKIRIQSALKHINALENQGCTARISTFAKWLKEIIISARVDLIKMQALEKEQIAQNLLKKKSEELELKNLELSKAQAELEDVMAMFAHKFRGPLDSIIFNSEHQHDERVYADAARTMNGLLDIFSYVSTSSEILAPKLRDDNSGADSPLAVFERSLKLAAMQLASVKSRQRMSPHYLNYAKKVGQAPAELTLSVWSDEEEWQEIERAYQSLWEDEIGQMFGTYALPELFAWFESHLMKFEIKGLAESTLTFLLHGPKASVLTVVLQELIVNAIKHYDTGSPMPIEVIWTESDKGITLDCLNPSTLGSRRRPNSKGSGRGHKFLGLIARNLHGTFTADVLSDATSVSLFIPSSIMKD